MDERAGAMPIGPSASPPAMVRTSLLDQPERLLVLMTYLTPLLWLLGLLIPGMLFALCLLLIKRPPKDIGAIALFAIWAVIGFCQIVSIIYNAYDDGDALTQFIGRTLSVPVAGWFLLGMAMAAGYQARMATPQLTNALAATGIYILLVGPVALALAAVTGLDKLIIPSPLALILPDGDFIRFYFSIAFFNVEPFAGDNRVRLILFYPWATLLALAGLMTFFVGRLSKNDWLRWLGCIGGLVAVVLSFSRMGMIAFFLVGGVLLALRFGWPIVAVAFGGAVVGAMALMLAGIPVDEMPMRFLEAVKAQRSGSSDVRELINTMSWQGFLQSPVFGHGFVGGPVTTVNITPVGSHSSTYGLLFVGGVVTFTAFVVGMLIFLAMGIRAAVRGGDIGRTGLLIVLLFFIFAHYESIFSFGLSCIPFFVWLGGALAHQADDAPSADPQPRGFRSGHGIRPSRPSPLSRPPDPSPLHTRGRTLPDGHGGATAAS